MDFDLSLPEEALEVTDNPPVCLSGIPSMDFRVCYLDAVIDRINVGEYPLFKNVVVKVA